MTHITQAEPRERPILFQGDMVRALLAGTKTQTRRICKAKRDLGSGCVLAPHELAGEVNQLGDYSNSPYGKPGDRLWVRESFKKIIGDSGYWIETDYRATYTHGDRLGDHLGEKHKWTPSIHMPRAASRITLEITEVRVEKLQAISEPDARAEGIAPHIRGGWHWHAHNPADLDDWHQFGFKTATQAYESLWRTINGDESWAANPWVWVMSFKVVKP